MTEQLKPDDYVSVEGLVQPKQTQIVRTLELVRRFYDQEFTLHHVVELALRDNTFKNRPRYQVYTALRKLVSNLVKEGKVVRVSNGIYANTKEN